MNSSRPPRVLLAPQAFKGTYGPQAVAKAMRRGVLRSFPHAEIENLPVADGGDGLIDVLTTPGSRIDQHEVDGPLGTALVGEILWPNPRTAIIESASACGLRLVDKSELDPLRASTLGVGQLMNCARNGGASTIVLGLGGSATVDLGTRPWVLHRATRSPGLSVPCLAIARPRHPLRYVRPSGSLSCILFRTAIQPVCPWRTPRLVSYRRCHASRRSRRPWA